MSEGWQQEQPQKTVAEILASLFDQLNKANVDYALDVIQHDEWSAEMRRIDGKLGVLGFRLDRPERFASKLGR